MGEIGKEKPYSLKNRTKQSSFRDKLFSLFLILSCILQSGFSKRLKRPKSTYELEEKHGNRIEVQERERLTEEFWEICESWVVGGGGTEGGGEEEENQKG